MADNPSILDDARSAGFSEDEIGSWVNSQRKEWNDAGFSDKEIDQWLTGMKEPHKVPDSFLNRVGSEVMKAPLASAAVGGWRAGFGEHPLLVTDEEMAQFRQANQNRPEWMRPLNVVDDTLLQTLKPAVAAMFRGVTGALFAAGAMGGEMLNTVFGGKDNAVEQESARREMAQFSMIVATLLGGNVAHITSTAPPVAVGKIPTQQDFTTAAKVMSPDNPGPTRQKLIEAYEDRGVHPAEAAHSIRAEDLGKEEPPQATPERAPIEKPLSESARTGDRILDGITNSYPTKRNIDNPIIDSSYSTPYGAGGSTPLELPVTYIDEHFPAEMEVGGIKFDPRKGLTIHENWEQHAMEILTASGMDEKTAYKVAHPMATEVEHAYYRSLGLKPEEVEAAYKPYLDKIQHEDPKNPPPDLYTKPYPHDDVAAAQAEPTGDIKPTAGEIARAKEILDQYLQAVDKDGNLITHYSEPVVHAGGNGSGDSGPPPNGPGAPEFLDPQDALPPKRQPYFVYDDRPGWQKAYSRILSGWKETFQPELVSDSALRADPLFAHYKSRKEAGHTAVLDRAEGEHQYWRSQADADRIQYMDQFEKAGGSKFKDEWQPRVNRHKMLLEEAYRLEKEHGSKASYFEDYFPHIWQDPVRARDWVNSRKSQIGPTWFQKERTFSHIQEGLDAGLRLKSTNPEDLVAMRLLSSADMVERMKLLRDLQQTGLANKVKPGKGLGPADTNVISAEQINLEREGWITISAPDREPWMISPDVQPLWKNAVEARGLWANEGAPGTVFRGWMAFKNAWVPIKLAISLFHPLHVAQIQVANAMARGWGQLTAGGDIAGALKSFGEGFSGSVRAAIPGVPHVGRMARSAWRVPENERTPAEKAVVQLMHEGGFVPEMSEELRINAKRSLENAIDNTDWLRGIPAALRRGIEKVQAPFFEHWIPNLKAAAYLKEAQALLYRRPELLDNREQRMVALRTIAKSMENRFGQMHYGTLFWNRTVKDSGIATFLSLGWQLGFLREYASAIPQAGIRTARKVLGTETETQATIAGAQNKLTMLFTYSFVSAMTAGLITWAFTGSPPTSALDYVFPRTGRKNPDGSEHRLTTMSYVREVPMAMKHIEEHGGNVPAGLADMMASKTMFGPIKELWDNRSYYGSDIWDVNAPVHQQTMQAMQHIVGEQFNPISVTGALRAIGTGGGATEAAMAFLGFGPAPSYAERSGTQNRIAYLFQRHVAPLTRPAEFGVKAKERGDIRNELLMAKQHGDQAVMREAVDKWYASGGSQQGLSNIMLGLGSDITMFRALPEPDQTAIMQQASPEERDRYKPWLKSNTTNKVAEFMVQGQKALARGDVATSEDYQQRIRDVILQAGQDGHMPNKSSFVRNIRQRVLSHYQPDISAIMSLPKSLRGLPMFSPQQQQ